MSANGAAIAVVPMAIDIERVLMTGDLSRLTPEQRVSYYNAVCESVGLNPLTRPFEYLRLNNREVLYARKDATDQLRKIHGVSITKLVKELVEGIYVVTASATDRSGRTDESIGAVSIGNLKGEATSLRSTPSLARKRSATRPRLLTRRRPR